MSKSMKWQSLFAGVALALFLMAVNLIGPVVAQDLTPAPAAAEATYAQPDHP